MKFTATTVEASTNTATANVIFADPETNPDEPSVLMFSRSIDIPDSAYYFEINDQSFGSYGGLELVRVSRNKIQVHLGPETVEQFGIADMAQVHVGFDIDDKTFQLVLRTLKNIFAGEDVLVVE